MTYARERLGMHSRWLSSEKVSEKKQEASELRARNSKTRTYCGTMESCLTFPQFHSTAATEMIIYDSDGPNKAKTKAKNSLDSKTQKRDNGKCLITS
jgi:hypothetical protein